MPTIGAHVSDEVEAAVKAAALTSPERKPGPWLAKAAIMRLEREGRLPPDPLAKVIAKAQEIGIERADRILTEAQRKECAA
jgi:hypothetical protein